MKTTTLTPALRQRLTQIETDIAEGIALVQAGRQKLWGAIATIQAEPELLTANGYESIHQWLEQRFGWARTTRYENLQAAEVFAGLLEFGTPNSAIPTSTSAMAELRKADAPTRPAILTDLQAQGKQPTREAIRDELPTYRPASDPETIREGLREGWITPTDKILYSAVGEPLVPGDYVAHVHNPTKLLGEVVGYTPERRVELERLGKKFDVFPDLLIHQQPIGSPIAPDFAPAAPGTAPANPNLIAPTTPAPEASKHAVHFSSESPEHYTPSRVILAVLECLGEIDLDPCSNSKSAPNVPARAHYTQHNNGLTYPWLGRIYMNPPYGTEIRAWVDKLIAEYEAANITEAIALVPARTDTQWFRSLRDFPVCFVSGRLTFLGNDAAAPFPSAIFYLGDRVEAFHAAFSPLGDIWQRIHEKLRETP